MYKSAKTMPWFILPSGLSPTNPVNYILVGVQPICPGTNRVCAINAVIGPGGFPVISGALKDQMIDALNMRTNHPNVLLKS